MWLNRSQLAVLFDRDIKTIGKHINNALQEELSDCPVVAKFATTARDGKTYRVEHYNLDMILSVGYRVKSKRGIEFRKWATAVLKEYLLRGYAIALSLDVDRHNRQYSPIDISTSDRFHDRFLIIDNTVYHIGASVKDLGKKLFAFNRMEVTAEEILQC